ncbi:MAG TPA: alanine racemase [Candidatus Acidoferrum sp.]|nr:alanine racemase [Candidatus Acidoferrum sp.]
MTTKRTTKMDFERRPVWAEVSLGALKHNIDAIRSFVNPKGEKRAAPRKVLCIVKGNGYGHGGPQVAKALEKFGSDWFGVTCTEEGIAVRKAGVKKPVLILTSFVAGEEPHLLRHDLTPVVHRIEQLAVLNRAAQKYAKKKTATFHLKIDSGMNRLGISPASVDSFAAQLAKCKYLKLGGIFTHFASSGVFLDTIAGRQTGDQEKRFYAALERLKKLGIDPGIVHLANSAAIASRPETWADMVRPGAILYGYHPGYDPTELREESERKLRLKPVMSLRSRIISLRDVPAGQGVGYDSTFITSRPSKIAVLAAGYGDGIHRSLGNKGKVLVRGTLAPIVGIVSMDVTMVDVTDVPGASLGDVATVYGTSGDDVLLANRVARTIGTVTSDLLCAVSARVPRFYVP